MNKLEKLSDYCETRKFMIEESIRLIDVDSQKHAGKVVGLWLMPLLIRGTGVVKDAYFFMRYIDDVLDGDLIIKENPLTSVENIRGDVLNENESEEYPVEKLAFRSLRILNQKRKENDDPKKEFLDGIDGMMRDYKRVEKKEVLTTNELRENYVKSFGPHHNISLMAIGSNLRSAGIESFSYCQGFSYGIQDLSTDWQRGLINIPRDVLTQSNLWVDSSVSEVKSSRIVKEWIGDESSKSRVDLNLFLKNISSLESEKSANLLFKMLSKRVEKILESNMQTKKIISVSGNN